MHDLDNTRLWYVWIKGIRKGPYSDIDMEERIAAGEIEWESPVWAPGMGERTTPAGSVPALVSFFPDPEGPPRFGAAALSRGIPGTQAHGLGGDGGPLARDAHAAATPGNGGTPAAPDKAGRGNGKAQEHADERRRKTTIVSLFGRAMEKRLLGGGDDSDAQKDTGDKRPGD